MTHTLIIPDFTPTPINQLYSGHWSKRRRLKRGDAELIAAYARQQAIPHAAGPRRVSLWVSYAKGQRRVDPDAIWKTTLDSLVHAKLLVNDSCAWVSLGPVELVRGDRRETRITLEDM